MSEDKKKQQPTTLEVLIQHWKGLAAESNCRKQSTNIENTR